MLPEQRDVPALPAAVVESGAGFGAAEGLSCADRVLCPHRVEACGDAGGHRLRRRGQPGSVHRFWDNRLPHAKGKGRVRREVGWFRCAFPVSLSRSCSIGSAALLHQNAPFEALPFHPSPKLWLGCSRDNCRVM